MAGFVLDPNELTVEETEVICDTMGIDDIRDLERMGEKIPPRLLRVLGWMAKRKDDPAFTMEQAGKLTQREIGELMNLPNFAGGNGAADSTPTLLPSATSTGTRRRSSGRSK